jgi:integrase
MNHIGRSGRQTSGKKHRGVYEQPLGSNVWWILYYDQYGKRHREKVGPKGLAIIAYQKRKTEIREGKFLPEKVNERRRAMLFEDMLTTYLDEYSKVNKRSYKTDLAMAVRLRRELSGKTLQEITTQDVERLKAKLKQEIAPATVNLHLALLKHLYTKAMEWGKTEKNPAKPVKFFRANNARVRYLTDEEEAQLKAVFLPEHWNKVEVAINTGMRRGEQFNLKWANVNFQTGVLTIPRSKHGEAHHIPMNDRVVEILRSLPSRMKSLYVFPSETGETPLNANNFINRVWNPAREQANLADLHWHDLRHTFASRLVMAGVDLRTVQELMGHKTITMTLRYTHLSPTHQREAVQRLIQEPTATTTAISHKVA